MTLEEILRKANFSELVQPVNIDPEAEENLYSFKEAFDLLRMTKVGVNDSESNHIPYNPY